MYNLLPLNRLETELYIQKRLSVAGAHDVDMFTPDALDEIFACAQGFPRLINIICDNALLFGCATNTYHINRDIVRRVAQDMDLRTLTFEEESPLESGVSTRPPSYPPEPRITASAVIPPTPPSAALPQPQDIVVPSPLPAAGEEADRIILQNTVFSEDNYWDYWDSLLRKNAGNENNLIHTWQQAAARESRRRLTRFLLIAVALLGLLGGIVGEQLGLWSLRGVVSHTWERVRQLVMVLSEMVVPPEAGPGRAQKQSEVSPRALPSGNERPAVSMSGPAVPQDPIRRAEGNRSPVSSVPVSSVPAPTTPLLPGAQLPTAAPTLLGGEQRLSIKKVVVVRSGDTLSKILTQEYGEYTKTVVDLVSEANPGLRNIHFLEIGQRLMLPDRPE
jgi:phage tail protein X